MDNKTIDLLEAAIRRRRVLSRRANALRLVNGLGDGLKGLVLEQYDRHFVVQIFDKRWLKEKEALAGFVRERCDGRYLIMKDRTLSVSSLPEAFIKIKTSPEFESPEPKGVTKSADTLGTVLSSVRSIKK